MSQEQKLSGAELAEFGLFLASLRATVRRGDKMTVCENDVEVFERAYGLLAASPAEQVKPERREVCEVRDEHDQGGTWQNGYDTGWNECLDTYKKGA